MKVKLFDIHEGIRGAMVPMPDKAREVLKAYGNKTVDTDDVKNDLERNLGDNFLVSVRDYGEDKYDGYDGSICIMSNGPVAMHSWKAVSFKKEPA